MKTRLSILCVAAWGALTGAVGLAWGHHAFEAEFDADKPVKLQGRVTKMEWINPHVWIHLDVKGPDGSIVNWAVEGGPPNALLKRGWNKNSLPEGTEIIVEGYQSKDGAARANAREVLFPDGKKLFAGSSAPGAEK